MIERPIASLKLRYLAQIPRHRMWMVLTGVAVVAAVAVVVIVAVIVERKPF
jgi:hypothetical protein